jgi:excinuclease ABC subunit C
VIDGGKGQLSAVLKVLKDMPNLPLNIETQIVALAKREEEIFRGKFAENGEIIFEELNIDINSAESKLLQRIRDEAHRFAISFNRNLRDKSAKKSRLDEIRGIGPKTKKELLQKFSSPSGIRNASDEKLLEILNTKQLENLRKNL